MWARNSRGGSVLRAKARAETTIIGGRGDEPIYQKIVHFLLDQEYEVPTAIIAETGIEEIDAVSDPNDIYERDVNWIRESDLLIAEVSTPSHGVGYEIAYALTLNKPVLALYEENRVISAMILGNTSPNLTVHSYPSIPRLLFQIKDFLSSLTN